MKKLYLILLMLLIMFIPGTHAVAVYQLDQPVSELNGYTLREVFEYGNNIGVDKSYNGGNASIINNNGILDIVGAGNSTYTFIDKTGFNIGDSYYFKAFYKPNIDVSSINFQRPISIIPPFNPSVWTEYSYKGISTYTEFRWIFYYDTAQDSLNKISQIDMNKSVYINLVLFGIDNLTVEQMDMYYDLYLEAVRFENENIEASQDPGGYQNIFKSIINGVKGLMESMGDLWRFLNAPIITSDMQDYSFGIDWSWDLIGVVRQLISNLARLILQTNFIFINVLLSFTGIPIQVSLLTLLFSNFVFVILGWIIVKSFII